MRILFALLSLFPFSFTYAQLLYPIVGDYRGTSAQGMAIHGNYAVLMNNTGICRLFDLREGIEKREFFLGSYAWTPHGNCLCFGKKKYNKHSVFPLLYVSACKEGDFRCMVEDIQKDSSYLLQTIEARADGVQLRVLNWVLDSRKQCLYAVLRNEKQVDEHGAFLHSIVKYRLPKISEGMNVVLTDNDRLSAFDIYYSSLLQDGIIRGNYLYLVGGANEKDMMAKKYRDRTLVVINLRKKHVEKLISLNEVIDREPEGLDFYKDSLLLFCGQEGGIFELKY